MKRELETDKWRLLPMPTPAKHKPIVERTIRDTGLASAFVASGFSTRLENREGVVYFVFQGDLEKFKELEDSFWDGRLKLPAKDLLMAQRSLKDRLYAAKATR
jgi:hypothetical protein